MYGAQLIEALHRRDASLEFFGAGGDRMRAAGCDTVVDAKDLSVVGITEILSHLPKIYGLYQHLIAEADRRKPDLAIVIDSPAFNWRVARQIKKRGIPVVYYVAPQFWAWRQGRVRLLRNYIDKALVIFPLKKSFTATAEWMRLSLAIPSPNCRAPQSTAATTPHNSISTLRNIGSLSCPAAVSKKFA